LVAHSSYKSPVPHELRVALESSLPGIRKAAVLELGRLLEVVPQAEREPVEAALHRRVADPDTGVGDAASAVLAGESVEVESWSRPQQPRLATDADKTTAAARESVDAYEAYVKRKRASEAAIEKIEAEVMGSAHTAEPSKPAKSGEPPRKTSPHATPPNVDSERTKSKQVMPREHRDPPRAREAEKLKRAEAESTKQATAERRAKAELAKQAAAERDAEAERAARVTAERVKRASNLKTAATIAYTVCAILVITLFGMSFAGVEDTSPSPYVIVGLPAAVIGLAGAVLSGLSD
jgi:hypothetical protein